MPLRLYNTLSRSIDEFLSSHQNDEIVIDCAKAAIALLIARAERNSHLNDQSSNLRHTDFVNLSATYLPRLWARLQRGIPIENWESFFYNLRIITFNYDRVVEKFFSLALQRFCKVTAQDADDFIARLSILHVYGSLGSVRANSPDYCPWQLRLNIVSEEILAGDNSQPSPETRSWNSFGSPSFCC